MGLVNGIGVGVPFYTPQGGFINNYSVAFDGIDEYVDCGGISALDSAANISVSFWFRPEVLNRRVMGVNVSSTSIFGFSMDGSGRLYTVFTNSIYGYTTTTLSTNTWYHITVVYDGSGVGNAARLKMYIDGSSDTLTFNGTIPATLTSNLSSVSWKLGTRDTNYAQGRIDESAIFDYSLTSGNVTTIYNSGTPHDLDTLDTPPIHWWRMGDGDTYPTINDVGTIGGNDGTMTNQEAGDINTTVP
jgi:hypothetical protein